MQIQDTGTSHLPCLILINVLVFCVINRYSLWFLKEYKLLVQSPPIYAVVEFQKVWSKLNFMQDRTECMYGQLYTYFCTRESSLNSNSNTQEPGWLQFDHLTSCGVTQQYPSATFIS